MPKMETDEKGIPLVASHPAVKMGIPVWLFYLLFNGVLLSIGMAVALLLILPAEPKFADKISVLTSGGFGWLFLGAWVLKLAQLAMGINLGSARTAAKVEVPDQQVYQVKGAAGSKLGYVLMETDGAIGTFNRAQRAVQNYGENAPLFMLMFVLAGWVAPFGIFVCACVYAVGRVVNAIGYTSAADSRIPGTLIGVLASNVIDSVVLVAGLRSV